MDGHTYTTKNSFYVSGDLNKTYKNTIVESSSHLSQNELNGVLPYDYSTKKPYNNSFILGYCVEHYEKSVFDCVETYKQIVNNKIKNDILRKYIYDGVDYLNVNTKFSNEKYLYHILPVYKFEYDYKNKKYKTYMNGQTGKIDKNIPKSPIKIFFVVFFAILLLLIPIILSLLSNLPILGD